MHEKITQMTNIRRLCQLAYTLSCILINLKHEGNHDDLLIWVT